MAIRRAKKPAQKTPSLAKDVESFQKYVTGLKSAFLDRDREIDAIAIALLSRHHVYLEGAPGTAKSALARAVFKGIKGSKLFETACTKRMTDEYFIGGIDMKKFREEGITRHVTDQDTIVGADFAFLDEFGDLNPLTMRVLLEVLNERTFTRPWQHEQCRLHTAILTANYRQEHEMTEAVYDRVLVRIDVKDIGSDSDRVKMFERTLAHKPLTSDATITLDCLNRLADAVSDSTVSFEPDYLPVYSSIIGEYSRDHGRVSDRRANQLLSFVKAKAILEGRTEVVPDDLSVLKYGLTVLNSAEHEAKVDMVIGRNTEDLETRLKASKACREALVLQDRLEKKAMSLYMENLITEVAEGRSPRSVLKKAVAFTQELYGELEKFKSRERFTGGGSPAVYALEQQLLRIEADITDMLDKFLVALDLYV